MAFELKNVVPWGRNLEEYKKMFNLMEEDYNKKIISFGDGPASFNYEMTSKMGSIVSIDPIYQFTESQLRKKILETKDIVAQQTKENQNNFLWSDIKNIEDLISIRMEAMNKFLEDFEKGKNQNRYISHELPKKTKFKDSYFDLGLSSHFLMLYPGLGIDFHIKSITEMLRICKEVRIFPLVNLNAEKSEVLDSIIEHFKSNYKVEISKVNYEFQKNANQMLVIK